MVLVNNHGTASHHMQWHTVMVVRVTQSVQEALVQRHAGVDGYRWYAANPVDNGVHCGFEHEKHGPFGFLECVGSHYPI